ncbi:hypothetical protein OEZ86_004591 [Tetradesmus obliquus]|nr:hypothetical protein OEZ86_004591 [Tetradesmus obliquus]
MSKLAVSLQLFCEHLQAWDELVGSGAAALAALQQAFGDLQPNGTQQDTPRILGKLKELAPSFGLDEYLASLKKGTASSSDPQLASGMHTAFTALQETVAAARQQLDGMQQLADECAAAALAVPLQEQQQMPAGLEGPCLQAAQQEGEQQQQQQQQQEQEQQGCQAAAEPAVLSSSGEEVALLLSGVAAGLQRDLEWMELAAGSISLDSSPDDLSTFSTLWQLQPFTDEAAVAAVWDAAAEAVAAAPADT